MSNRSSHKFLMTVDDKTAKGFNSAKKGINSMNKSLTGLNNKATALIGVIGAKFTFENIVGTAKEFETLSLSLETAFGSAEAATEKFAELNDFAAKTPFTIQDLTEAAIRLKNLGLDPSIEALTSLGNTSASLGKPLMQAVEAIGDAALGGFVRLEEFGIKARTEGDKIKFIFRGVTTEVQNNAAAIEKYLLDLGNVEFAGAIEKQSTSLAGLFSTLKGSADSLIVKLSEKTGLTGVLKSSAKAMIELFDTMNLQLSDPQDLGLETLTQELEKLRIKYGDLMVAFDSANSIVERSQLSGELVRIKDKIVDFQMALDNKATPAVKENTRAVKSHIEMMKEHKKSLDDTMGEAIKLYQDQWKEAMKFYEDTKTPMQEYEATLKRINELEMGGFFEGIGGAETANRAAQKAFDDMQGKLEKTEMQTFIEESKNTSKQFDSMWATSFERLAQGAGSAFSQSIMYGRNLSDSLRGTLRGVTGQVIASLGTIAAKKLSIMALEKLGIATTATASAAAAGATTAAWTPAAAVVSLGTGGANAVTASGTLPMFFATLAAALASFKGQMHGGGIVPSTGTYFLEGGESVTSKKHTEKLAKALDFGVGGTNVSFNITIQALDTTSATQVILQNEPAITNMVQRAFNSNGRPGPLG